MVQSAQALLRLQQQVYWTKKFALMNVTALRKITKKRDKLFADKGNVGQRFMEVRPPQD